MPERAIGDQGLDRFQGPAPAGWSDRPDRLKERIAGFKNFFGRSVFYYFKDANAGFSLTRERRPKIHYSRTKIIPLDSP
jgi:hypothetical protein